MGSVPEGYIIYVRKNNGEYSMNDLNHNYKLANLHGEAHMARWEKRHVTAKKAARIASKRYNKAVRKASKLQLKKYAS